MSGDQLRLSKVEFKTLLETLNQTDSASAKAMTSRKHRRYALPPGWSITVEMQQPGGNATKCPGVIRDISRGGASMLYVGFVHSGATIKFTFRGPDDGFSLHSEGKVVRCRHVKAHIHELGIRFDTDLPLEFLVPAEKAESGAMSQDYARVAQSIDMLARAVKSNSPIATIRQLVDGLKSDLDQCKDAPGCGERNAA